MRPRTTQRTTIVTIVLALAAGAGTTVPDRRGTDEAARAVSEHWTAARVAAAVPRDLVVDAHGRGYVRTSDGRLAPHGHDGPPAATPLREVPTQRPDPGEPAGARGSRPAFDTEPPEVVDVDPAPGATIEGTRTFGATVTDASGVKDVRIHVAFPADSPPQTFHATREDPSTDRWSVVLDGLEGHGVRGTWWLEARDGARRGGNTTVTPATQFWVTSGEDGVGPGGTVAHAPWPTPGPVQAATSRVLFELPSPDDPGVWSGWWCSGSVVADGATERSVVLTAAHCIFDEVNGVFARNVLVVPDQGGTASGTNRICSDDPVGCWVPSFGVVPPGWAARSWPDNIPSDVGWYVVPDSGAHLEGQAPAAEALDVTVPGLAVRFDTVGTGAFTHALGFSATHDPTLMYCAEPIGLDATHETLWLDGCGLVNGASGGPWIEPMDLAAGNGPVVSVNSWRWPGRDGMGGPHLSTGTAACTFTAARQDDPTPERGLIPSGC